MRNPLTDTELMPVPTPTVPLSSVQKYVLAHMQALDILEDVLEILSDDIILEINAIRGDCQCDYVVERILRLHEEQKQ